MYCTGTSNLRVKLYLTFIKRRFEEICCNKKPVLYSQTSCYFLIKNQWCDRRQSNTTCSPKNLARTGAYTLHCFWSGACTLPISACLQTKNLMESAQRVGQTKGSRSTCRRYNMYIRTDREGRFLGSVINRAPPSEASD